MTTNEDDTVVTHDGALRVESIARECSPHFEARARMVFANIRTEMSPEVFFFGRIVNQDASDRYVDFAQRLNKLFALFDGTNAWPWESGIAAPRIEACICDPLEIPLAKLIGSPDRAMLIAYVFVEGLPVTSWETNKVSPGNYEERRLWINAIVGKVILASREGELSMNPEE